MKLVSIVNVVFVKYRVSYRLQLCFSCSRIAETEAEIEERIAKWDKFLEDEDEKKEAAKKKGVEDVEVEQKTV